MIAAMLCLMLDYKTVPTELSETGKGWNEYHSLYCKLVALAKYVKILDLIIYKILEIKLSDWSGSYTQKETQSWQTSSSR